MLAISLYAQFLHITDMIGQSEQYEFYEKARLDLISKHGNLAAKTEKALPVNNAGARNNTGFDYFGRKGTPANPAKDGSGRLSAAMTPLLSHTGTAQTSNHDLNADHWRVLVTDLPYHRGDSPMADICKDVLSLLRSELQLWELLFASSGSSAAANSGVSTSSTVAPNIRAASAYANIASAAIEMITAKLHPWLLVEPEQVVKLNQEGMLRHVRYTITTILSAYYAISMCHLYVIILRIYM